jgi:glutathione S-transferase
MAEMEFGYWKIRGLAAAIKMMLYYKQQTFKQVAYGEDADAEWFAKDKPELKKKNSMINLPYLIDDEEVITQSNSILLYLGLKLGIDLPDDRQPPGP